MFDVFPKDDHEQSLRIKRFFMAFAGYCLWCSISVFTYLLGISAISIYLMLGFFSVVLIGNILIYAVFRSGFNKRFKDPSLTLAQMVIATFWIMVVLYYADTGRGGVLILYLIVFVFGLFKLNLRQFLYLSAFAVLNYATVLLLLYRNRPESIDARHEILNLIVLAVVLPWFSFIGGYITRLKNKVAESLAMVKEAELQFRTIFDSASDGITLIDIKRGSFTAANEKLCSMLGYTQDEFLKLKLSDLHPGELLKSVADKYHQLNNRELAIAKNIPIIKKDQTMFYTDISGSKIVMNGKEYSIGIVRDITERRQAEELLKASEQRYRLLADNVSDIIFTMDMNLHYTYLSPSAYRIGGYSADDLKNLNIEDMVDAATFRRFVDIFLEELEKEKQPDCDRKRVRTLEYQHILKGGSKLWLGATISFLRDENNRAVGIIGTAHDISERKQMEETLRFEEKRFRNFVEHSSDIIVLINMDGIVTYINPAVQQVLGYKPEERIGSASLELVHPDDIRPLTESCLSLFTDPDAPVVYTEYRLRHKNGTYRTMEAVCINLVKDHVIEGVMNNLRDITERKLAQEALQKSEQRYQELSIIDDLTRLYNSRHFYVQLEKEIERANRYDQPLTLLLLDLDKFKSFNDTFGHVEGDHVLSRLGQVVKRCLRDPDSAYRYGGEEFTILLPMTTESEGMVTAQRIRDEFRKEAFAPRPDEEVFVTMSIGVSQYIPKEDIKAFVHRVDQHMYQAKKNGRDRICSGQ